MTTNYNKVKNEGVEEYSRLKARKERVDAWLCATCGRPDNHDEVTEFGIFTHQWDYGADARMFNEVDFLSTFAEKVHKATLEDVLEFLGEIDVPYFEPNDIHESGQIVGKNKERQRIRDYIKTLTK